MTTSRTRIAWLCLYGLFPGSLVQAGLNEPPLYEMIELGNIVQNSTQGSLPRAISDTTPNGPVVVGESFSSLFTPPTLSWRAVVWQPDISLTPTDLLTLAQAGNSTVNRAQDVSPSGDYIVGYSNVAPPRGKRWTFDPQAGVVVSVESLGPLAGDLASEAVGVNSAGRAAGYSLTDSSTTRGVTWAPGSTTATALATPSGSGGFRLARRISEAPVEHIVGRCDMSSTPTTRPIIWKQSGGTYGTGEILDLLFPTTVHDAVGIRPDGQTAVGLGGDSAQSFGVAWNTTTNEVTNMGALPGTFQNVVYDMNDAGVGVGYNGFELDIFRAVLYWEGQVYDLNTRIVNNPLIGSSLFLHFATGINNAGQIIGKFGEFGSGEPLTPGRAFLLTPVPQECDIPGDVNQDGVVDGQDIAGYVRAQLGQPPLPGEQPECAALPVDGFVDLLLP